MYLCAYVVHVFLIFLLLLAFQNINKLVSVGLSKSFLYIKKMQNQHRIGFAFYRKRITCFLFYDDHTCFINELVILFNDQFIISRRKFV